MNDPTVQDETELDSNSSIMDEILDSPSDENENEDINMLRRSNAMAMSESAANKSRYDSAVGLIRKGKVELEAIKEQAETAKRELAALRNERSVASFDLPKPEEVTSQELETYSNAIPVINKLVNRAISDVLGKALKVLQSRLDTIETRLSESESTGLARTAILSARTIVPNMEELRRHPAWPKFLDSVDEVTEDTFQQTLSSAINGSKNNTIKRVFDTFEKMYVKSQRSVGAPSMSSAATSERGQKDTRTYKASEFNSLSLQRRAGRINNTDWLKVTERFDKAQAEGRFIQDI